MYCVWGAIVPGYHNHTRVIYRQLSLPRRSDAHSAMAPKRFIDIYYSLPWPEASRTLAFQYFVK